MGQQFSFQKVWKILLFIQLQTLTWPSASRSISSSSSSMSMTSRPMTSSYWSSSSLKLQVIFNEINALFLQLNQNLTNWALIMKVTFLTNFQDWIHLFFNLHKEDKRKQKKTSRAFFFNDIRFLGKARQFKIILKVKNINTESNTHYCL